MPFSFFETPQSKYISSDEHHHHHYSHTRTPQGQIANEDKTNIPSTSPLPKPRARPGPKHQLMLSNKRTKLHTIFSLFPSSPLMTSFSSEQSVLNCQTEKQQPFAHVHTNTLLMLDSAAHTQSNLHLPPPLHGSSVGRARRRESAEARRLDHNSKSGSTRGGGSGAGNTHCTYRIVPNRAESYTIIIAALTRTLSPAHASPHCIPSTAGGEQAIGPRPIH